MTRNASKVNNLPTPDQPLTATVGGSVTEDEKSEIVKTLSHYGWAQSSGVRVVMKSFVDSTKVRDAVMEHLHSLAA